jgi:hypothetical protein
MTSQHSDPKPQSHNCDGCRHVCSHPNADYYEPKEIRFCRTQMLWLCAHLGFLEIGKWKSRESGYIDTERIFSNVPPARAPWQTPIELAGEVRVRLKPTGEDGETLLAEALLTQEYSGLSQAARNALNYASGWKRREMYYAQWLAQGSYRRSQKMKLAK